MKDILLKVLFSLSLLMPLSVSAQTPFRANQEIITPYFGVLMATGSASSFIGASSSPTVASITATSTTLLSFLQQFIFTNATGTAATTTNFFSTTASSTNLFGQFFNGFGLITCNSASNALTWAAGSFGCNTITGSGTSPDPFTHPVTSPFTSATSSNMLFSGSTTLQNFTFINATGTAATTTSFFSTNASSTNLWLATGAGMLSVSAGGLVQSTTISSPLSFSAATLSCPTCAVTGTTITINGTTGQITSSAGSQDLSANHTWTLSLPSFVQITNLTASNSTTTLATTTQATTTTFAISRLANVPLYVNSIGSVISAGSGTSGNCVQWGASNTLGDAGSACGTGGGGGVDQWSPHFALGYSATTSVIGIGTTTPQWMLTISSSTAPQLALTDGVITDNHWTMRSVGNLFYVATASPSTFATSSMSALTININGFLGIGSTSPGQSLSVFGNSFVTGNSTSSRSFATEASSTNLFATSLNTGLVTSGAINGQTISSASNFTGTMTVTTSITNPILIGGTAVGSSLELRSTSGNGVGAEFTKFTVGNNGATEIARVNLAGIGIGTTTPQWELTVSSSTRPQLALTDATVTSAPWVFRSVSGSLFIATSSPAATFATTSMSAITITPNNAVGIGSTSPTQMLSVAGGVLIAGNSTTTNLEVKSAAQVSTTSGYALVSVGAPAGVTSYFAIGSTTSNGGNGTVLSVNSQNYASIAAGTSTPDAVFAFNASSTSATAANINILDVASTSAGSSLNTSLFRITTSGAIFAPLTSSSGSSQTGYWCYDANGQLIRDSAVCLVSALKFKKDVKDLDVGLSDLMKLRPVSYFYKDPSFGANQQMGFIADEVASSSPKLNEMLVNYDSTGAVHSFNYMQFTSLITKSLQQLVRQVQIIWVLIGGLILWNIMLTRKLRRHENR